MKLYNNCILITGGTSGIGVALARELKAKNKVIVLGRNTQKLEELKNDGFEVIHCDMNNLDDIERAAMDIEKMHPDLNVVFNNAGIQYNYQITDTIVPLAKVGREININFTAQVIFTHLLIPLIANKENGYIKNTTSALGAFPKTDGLVYSATKAAMRSFNQGLRFALKNTGIKVIEFIPPVTATPMTKARNEKKSSVNEVIQAILPQLEKDRSVVTVKSIRFFIWLAARFPNLAHKILTK